jgi:hypothetical protein
VAGRRRHRRADGRLPVAARPSLENLFVGAAELFLSIEDIQAESATGAGYAVYLNIPDLFSPGDRARHQVGLVTLFGMELLNDPNVEHPGAPGLQHTFNVSALVSQLAAAGLFDPTAVAVTVEPVDMSETDDPSLQLDLNQLPPVRIGRISLFVG